MDKEIKKPLILAIVLTMICSSFLIPVGRADKQNNYELLIENEKPLESSFPFSQGKVQPSIIQQAESKQWVKIVVATTNIGELANALKEEHFKGLLGNKGDGGPAFPVLEVPPNLLPKIASLDSTIGVFEYPQPIKHIFEDVDAFSVGRIVPNNLNSTINHGAFAAWARNFTGDGIRIAVVDDGIDFSHPDLMGSEARFDVSHVPESILQDKSYLATYDGWPIAFDPASMLIYFSKNGIVDGTWYANTTSKDRNVTHTIRIDGKNDFWQDGSELIATDSIADISVPDYNLISLYVTQDRDHWYIGFNSLANQTNMSFGIYINTTKSAPWDAGATYDPLGNYIDTLASHRPEFAIYMVHNGLQEKGRWDKNDTIEEAKVFAWNQSLSSWVPSNGLNLTDISVGGKFAYSGWDFEKNEGFVELSIPKKFLGYPQEISLELFTAGIDKSHAQDTCYSDLNVEFADPEWSPITTTLSAFTIVGRGFWRHTYTRPDDTIAGVLNTNKSWALEYMTTGTSKSGNYLFGDHPDENYPLTRILVVDEAQAGVYDTVYVDLDHNKDFRNDKPLKKYGKYDSNMVWHPINWTGAGTIYDEISFGDFYDPAYGVTSVDWSPDGKKIVSGSSDHTAIIWNVTSGKVDKVLHGHSGRVSSVSWSPDGKMIAAGYDDSSGSGDFDIIVWNASDGKILKTFEGHQASVNSLAWSPASDEIVSGSSDLTIRIWNLVSGQRAVLSGHADKVNSVDWSSNGRIASGSSDGTIRIWSSLGTLLNTFVYGNEVNSVAFNPNSTWLALGSSDASVTIWNPSNGLFKSSGGGAHFGNRVNDVDWSPDGTRLVSSSKITSDSDPSIVTWIVNNYDDFSPSLQKFSAHVEGGKGYDVSSVAWSPDWKNITSGGMDSHVKVWNATALIELRKLKGHTVGSTDTTKYMAGDGIPDVSGGIIYFIAQNYYNPQSKRWETPIPYSDVFARRYGMDNLIPQNGTLVAFMGALDMEQGHGTLVASSIVGKGISRYFDPDNMKEASSPQVIGMAPKAKLIPIANIYYSNFLDGWYFSVEGYDGKPGTGDEALIVSNSFGFSRIYHDGWDFQSRFLDWLVLEHAEGKVTFTVSSGNDGSGYGTVTSPASATSVVSVGASTDFYYRRYSGLEGGTSPSYGDVVPFSSRGPTSMGRPDPDVLANGRMAFGSVALNMNLPYDGSVASTLWSGTSLSSPSAAGILALIFEAYKKAHGSYPDAITARSILMSGADDMGNDVLAQGAGYANADRSTKIANNLGGLLVSPSLWVPGSYQGARYEAFASLMKPGDSDSKEFRIQNMNKSTGSTVIVSDGVFRKIGEVQYSFLTPVDVAGNPKDDWSYVVSTSPLAASFGGPGVYRIGTLGFIKEAEINLTLWKETELLKITIFANQTGLDPNLDGANDYRYMLDVYDWTYDWIPPPIPDTARFSDLNRMTISHPDANLIEVRVHNPAARTHDALVLGVRLFGKGAGGIEFRVSLEFYKKEDWNWMKLNGMDGSLSLPIAANGSSKFTAEMVVPLDTPIGTYEGAIYVQGDEGHLNESISIGPFGGQFVLLERGEVKDALVYKNGAEQTESIDYAISKKTGVVEFLSPLAPGDVVIVDYWYYNVTTIPVVVSVPADGTQFQFGGFAAGQDDLYRNSICGGFGGGGQSGDWRFLYVDVPDQGLYKYSRSLKFLIDVLWQYNRTDLDAFAFGPGFVDTHGVLFSPSLYGPYIFFVNNGGSEETATLFTTTGMNEEMVAPTLVGGLNVIAFHHVRSNGTAHEERINGRVGTMDVNPPEVKVVTNQLSGTKDIHIHSSLSWAGIGAVSAGPSAPERYSNLTIYQDDIEGEDFIQLLAKGSYTKVIKVQKTALIFDVHITSDAATTEKPSPDLDLGIFLDGKGPDNVPDGVAQPEEFVAMQADADADEEVKLIKPQVEDDPDTPTINEALEGAPYIIKVLGYDVPWHPGTFNMDITLVQGEGFTVEGQTSSLIPAHELSTVYLTWNLPGSTQDGKMLGALYVGPSFAPLTLLIPVEITIDRSPPIISEFSIAALGHQINQMDNRTTNDQRPTLSVGLSDFERGELDWMSVKVFLDERNVTSWSSITIPFDSPKGILGFWSGTIRYNPSSPLEEGPHSFKVEVKDRAGNIAQESYTFIIDTLAPILIVEGPLETFTNHSYAIISGRSERDKTVFIRDKTVIVDSSGRFSANLTLIEGINDIQITVADWFDKDISGRLIPANTATLTKRIVYDTYPPVFSGVSTSTRSLTNKDGTMVIGEIVEPITSSGTWDPRTVRLTINGVKTAVMSDGSFQEMVPLSEGTNEIELVALDLAGNVATFDIIVVRDTLPPHLDIEPLPEVVTEETIVVRGIVEKGAFLTLNGKVIMPDLNGSFLSDVSLSKGLNILVIEATDAAGNTYEKRLEVIYSPVQPFDYAPYVLVSLLLILALMSGYFFALKTAKKPEEVKKEEVPPREIEEEIPEIEEEALEELPEKTKEVAEEAPPVKEEKMLSVEEERIAKLRRAYEEGRISKELYEKNLERLKKDLPP